MFDLDFFLSQDGWNIYIFLFLSLLAGAFGLPLPEDIPLIAAGVLIQGKQAKLLPTFLICYIGILLGDIIIYFIGRLFGPTLYKRKWFQKKIKKHGFKMKNMRSKLENKSLLTIFIARHLFWIRTATFLLCGIVRIKPIKFIVADVIAATISVPLMMSLGYFFSANLENIFGKIRHAENTIFLGILLIVLGYIAYRLFIKKTFFKINDSTLKTLENNEQE
ncbi:MAG: DedA family protein [Bdellovibrionota bacterium]